MRELGHPEYKKVKKVYVNGCVGFKVGFEHHFPFESLEWAHAHTCKNDPNYRAICVRWEQLLESSAKDEILAHEYAHVLATYRGLAFTCEDHLLIYCKAKDLPAIRNEFQDIGHGEIWSKSLQELGYTPKRSVDMPFEEYMAMKSKIDGVSIST